MSTRNVVFILLGVILLCLLGIFSIFKITRVPDVDWKRDYSYESQEPYGAWMFNELIEKQFGSSQIVYNSRDTFLADIESNQNLYVFLSMSGNTLGITQKRNAIIEFAERGNQVVLIGNDFYHSLDTMFYFQNTDLVDRDTVTTVSIEENGSRESFSYYHYTKDFKNNELLRYREIISTESFEMTPVGDIQDCEDIVFADFAVGAGNIYVHSIPEMFSNHAAKQAFYLEHFMSCFGRFDPEMVILDHASFEIQKNLDKLDSPIQYVLADKSLSAAYFLLLATCFLYVVFQSKRKQRVIPILEKNTNTSLEYVQILSSLYQSHDKPQLLFPYVRKYFFHKVKMKYHLDERHGDFSKILAKKSSVNIDEIDSLLNLLTISKTKSTSKFPKDRLIFLHNRIEQFFNKAK